MGAAFEVRFGCGGDAHPRSTAWRMWAFSRKKSDVYVSARHLGGEFKISFHETGACHVGATRELVAKLKASGTWPDRTRFFDQWTRTPNIANDVCLAMRIWMPAADLFDAPSESSSAKPVRWYPPPAKNQMAEFAILFTKARPPPGTWPGQGKMKASLVADFDLPNGETVWLLFRHEEIPNRVRTMIRDVRAQVRGKVPVIGSVDRDVTKPSRRVILGGASDDGARYSIEVAASTVFTPDVEPEWLVERDG